MFEKLVEHLLLEDAFNLSQDPKNTLLLWYYNLSSGQFEYSTTATNHSEIVRAKNISLDRNWIRGRIIKNNGRVYLIAFLKKFLHNPLTSNSLPDLIHKIKNVFNVHIDRYVDDMGFELKETKN